MNGSLFWLKRSISIGITLIMAYLIVNLGRNVWQLWQAGGQVTEVERQVKQSAYEQYRLSQRLKEVESDIFIDQQIREQLQLGKAGEVMVLGADSAPSNEAGGQQNNLELRTENEEPSFASDYAKVSSDKKATEGKQERLLENWERWVERFR